MNIDDGRLRAHLLPGEKLLWVGRPVERKRLSQKKIDERLPAFLLFLVICILWLLFPDEAPLGFWLCLLLLSALVFIRAGLWREERVGVIYAVTNKRVVACRPGTRVASLPIEGLKVSIVETDGSAGTLRFGGMKQALFSSMSGWRPRLPIPPVWLGLTIPVPGFMDIPDVENVASIIHKAQSSPPSPEKWD